MQYTIPNIPAELDKLLRQRAHRENKSLEDVVVEVLKEGTHANGTPARKRDLSDVAGQWVDDPACDEAMKGFEQIDEEKWK